MESAHAYLEAGVAKLPRDIERARELIRLYADQADQNPPALALQRANDAARHDAAIGLVVGVDFNLYSRSKNLPAARILSQAVHAGERVGRQRRAEPLDRIAVVVVVRRLDENESK